MARQYKPTKREIKSRCELLLWMELMNWPWDVIDSCLYNDMPTPQTVRHLVWKHGPVKALDILERMLK